MSAGPVIAAVLWYLGLLALLAVPIALARHFRNHRAAGEVSRPSSRNCSNYIADHPESGLFSYERCC